MSKRIIGNTAPKQLHTSPFSARPIWVRSTTVGLLIGLVRRTSVRPTKQPTNRPIIARPCPTCNEVTCQSCLSTTKPSRGTCLLAQPYASQVYTAKLRNPYTFQQTSSRASSNIRPLPYDTTLSTASWPTAISSFLSSISILRASSVRFHIWLSNTKPSIMVAWMASLFSDIDKPTGCIIHMKT